MRGDGVSVGSHKADGPVVKVGRGETKDGAAGGNVGR